MVWYTVHLLWVVVLRLDCHALVDLADRLKISWRFQAENSCRWDMSWWMELALVLSPTLRVFGGWADRVSPQLSSQCEAQEEKLPSDGWEQRLRVNSQFGNVNVTSIINNPAVKEKKNHNPNVLLQMKLWHREVAGKIKISFLPWSYNKGFVIHTQQCHYK